MAVTPDAVPNPEQSAAERKAEKPSRFRSTVTNLYHVTGADLDDLYSHAKGGPRAGSLYQARDKLQAEQFAEAKKIVEDVFTAYQSKKMKILRRDPETDSTGKKRDASSQKKLLEAQGEINAVIEKFEAVIAGLQELIEKQGKEAEKQTTEAARTAPANEKDTSLSGLLPAGFRAAFQSAQKAKAPVQLGGGDYELVPVTTPEDLVAGDF